MLLDASSLIQMVLSWLRPTLRENNPVFLEARDWKKRLSIFAFGPMGSMEASEGLAAVQQMPGGRVL